MLEPPQDLLEKARQTLKHAYVPYSHFPVGAALKSSSGTIYTGVNIENISFGLTNCAERTAIFTAIASGKRKFDALVIIGETNEPIAPCGACRQVMVEFFKPDMPIWLTNTAGKTVQTDISQLMPGAFDSLT